VLKTSTYPPSSHEGLVKGYRASLKYVHPIWHEMTKRNYLKQQIASFSDPKLQLKPDELQPLKKLERIIMTMETKKKLSPAKRKFMIDSVHRLYDLGSFDPMDKPHHKRMSLLDLIKKEARDPVAALKQK
jgi:hypothetical protein